VNAYRAATHDATANPSTMRNNAMVAWVACRRYSPPAVEPDRLAGQEGGTLRAEERGQPAHLHWITPRAVLEAAPAAGHRSGTAPGEFTAVFPDSPRSIRAAVSRSHQSPIRKLAIRCHLPIDSMLR